MRFLRLIPILLFFGFSAKAGGYYKYVTLSYGDVVPDTVRVKVYKLGSGLIPVQVGSDSVWSSFGSTKTFQYSLDSLNSYEIQIFEKWFGFANYEMPSVRFVPVLEYTAILNTGSGGNTVRYYAVDTSGVDQAVQNVVVTAKTKAGIFEASQYTNSSGYTRYDFTFPADTFVVNAYRSGYIWIVDTIAVTGNATDTIKGYDIPTLTPPSPDYATVKGYVFTPGARKFYGGKIRAYRTKGDFATDTTTTAMIIGKADETAPIDTSGYFTMTLMRTSAYDDTTTGLYNFIGIGVDGAEIFKLVNVSIPSTGDIDLGQIAARRKQ